MEEKQAQVQEKIASVLRDHADHEDQIFNDRLNFFLVFESVLLGVVGILYNDQPSKTSFLKLMILLGFLLTVIWGYIQARQKYILDGIKKRLKEIDPVYQITLSERAKTKWPFSATSLLTYVIPIIIVVAWVILFFTI